MQWMRIAGWNSRSSRSFSPRSAINRYGWNSSSFYRKQNRLWFFYKSFVSMLFAHLVPSLNAVTEPSLISKGKCNLKRDHLLYCTPISSRRKQLRTNDRFIVSGRDMSCDHTLHQLQPLFLSPTKLWSYFYYLLQIDHAKQIEKC